MTIVLSRADVLESLDIDGCIAAVQQAFRDEALGRTLPAGIAATHAGLGGFHVKTAGLVGDRHYYAAKINANFPKNPARHGRPTIQGVISLHDAETGTLLALLDSPSITALRTAAATAVAAKYLARKNARTVAIAGCGVQAKYQLRALNRVRAIESVQAYDLDRAVSERFAKEMRGELAYDVTAVDDFRCAAADADIIVTCTTAHGPILSTSDVGRGAFIAAVGADSPEKQELDPALLANGKLVVDSLGQCAAFGELHHAIHHGVMSANDVHATISQLVVETRLGRESDSEITIFDSTGTGLEDVAAAAAVYERAVAMRLGVSIHLDA